jgi:hypothetical protein
MATGSVAEVHVVKVLSKPLRILSLLLYSGHYYGAFRISDYIASNIGMIQG